MSFTANPKNDYPDEDFAQEFGLQQKFDKSLNQQIYTGMSMLCWADPEQLVT